MSNLIFNLKYKGYDVGNKVKVVDMFTKKQKFLPPEKWVTFRNETGDRSRSEYSGKPGGTAALPGGLPKARDTIRRVLREA